MNPLVRRALGAACAVTVTLGMTAGLAPSAYAEKLVHQDARRDVTWFDDGNATFDPAPRAQDPDIVRVTIDHRAGALLIRTKYAALNRRIFRIDSADIRTSGGKLFSGSVIVSRKGRWQGHANLIAADDASNPDSPEVQCRDLRHRFDYDANVSIWTIPRICIGRPKWVRVAVMGMRGASTSVYFDDAFLKGYDGGPGFSRRIWRG